MELSRFTGSDLFDACLSKYARTSLIPAVTPHRHLTNLSHHFHFPVFIKRDDLTGFGIGGNKARKLEYLIADAINSRATDIVTGGGVQSNFASMAAIAARGHGLKCHLALIETVPVCSPFYDEGGNIAIDRIAGAKTQRIPGDSNISESISRLAAEIGETKGQTPYEIPIGGSNDIGTMGFVRGALEYAAQVKSYSTPIDTIVVASGSAGTQAGLIVGLELAKCSQSVIGISVLHSKPDLRKRVLTLCETLAVKLGLDNIDWNKRIQVEVGFIAKGYGLPSKTTWDSIETLVASDGIICDPVYSGKALHGLLTLLQNHRQQLGRGVTFWHTGGGVGLLAYADQIKTHFTNRRDQNASIGKWKQ